MKNDAKILITAADNTAGAFGSVKRGLSGVGTEVDRLHTTMAGLGVLAGGALLVEGVRRSAEYADQMGKTAQKIGATTEEFSALAYAASLADVSNETLATGLKKLSTEILSGGDKLAQLGIKTTDANGKLRATSDIVADVAEVFSRMDDGAKKTAIAVDIFGKSGSDLIPLLNTGRDGIKDAADEAQRFGLIVSKEAAAAAEQFNDNLTRLKASAQGATIALTSDLVKGLGEATRAFLEASREGSTFSGVLAGIQTLLTGTDRYKNDKALVEQTDALLKAENELARARSAPIKIPGRILIAEAELKKVQDALRTTQAYRRLLDEADAKAAPKPKTEGPAYTVKGDDKPRQGPKATKDATGDAERALAQYVKGLQAGIDKTEELTEVEKARQFLTGLGLTGEVAQVRELVLGLAERIDHEKELAELLKLRRAAATAAGDAVNKENEWFAAAIAATPSARLERQRQDMVRLAEGFGAGVFGDPATEAAMLRYGETAQTMLGNVAESVKEVEGDFASLGATFSSALEDAIVQGEDLRSVLQGLGQDILRITVRKTLTEPIGNAVSGLFKGASLGSLFSFLPGFADGLDYVPHDNFIARLHKGERVLTAAEAKSGAKAGNTVVVNINNTVGDVASVSTVVQGMKTVRAQIVGELSRSQRFGGALA